MTEFSAEPSHLMDMNSPSPALSGLDPLISFDDRVIPLAAPVRTRLGVWLNQRNRRWPASANPLRKDRILHEFHAPGGDIRRVCDLFGLSVEGATRYLPTIEHSDLTVEGDRVHDSSKKP